MLDKLASMFNSEQVHTVSQILTSVSNFVQFIDQRSGSDPAKTNEIIEQVKSLFDHYKK